MTTITIERALLEQAKNLLYRFMPDNFRDQNDQIAMLAKMEESLEAPATASERKPMPTLEVNARWEQSVLDITREQYQQVVREVEAFHGITGGKT